MLARTGALNDARREDKIGLTRRQANIDRPTSGVEATVATPTVDDGERITLAHDDVSHRRVDRRVDHGERTQCGIEHPGNTVGLQVEMRIRRDQLGLGHVQHTSAGQVKICAPPINRCSRSQHRCSCGVIDTNEIDLTIETDTALTIAKAMITKLKGLVAAQNIELNLVKSSSALDCQVPYPVGVDGVVATAQAYVGRQHIAQVDHVILRVEDVNAVGTFNIDCLTAGTKRNFRGVSAFDINHVVAVGHRDPVVAGAHVDERRRIAAYEGIVARKAIEAQAINIPAVKGVRPATTTNNAVWRTAEDVEDVVAGCGLVRVVVDQQPGIHSVTNMQEVVSAACIGHNGLDTMEGFFVAQRANDHTAGLVALPFPNALQEVAFVNDVVVPRCTITTRIVPHAQVKRITHLSSDNRIWPQLPKLAETDRNPDNRHFHVQQGANRRQSYLAREPGQGLVDLEQAEINVDPDTSEYCRTDDVMTQCQRHSKIDTYDLEIKAEIDIALDPPLTLGVEVTANVYREKTKEIKLGLIDCQSEYIVDKAHTTRELNLEGQHLEGGIQIECKSGASRHTSVCPGVAGIDLQHAFAGNAGNIDTQDHIQLGTHSEDCAFVGIEDGCGRLDLQIAKQAQLHHDIEVGLQALLVDQQIDLAAHLEPSRQFDQSTTRKTKHARVEINALDLTRKDITRFIKLERIDLAYTTRGIELEQEAATNFDRPGLEQS